MRKVLFVLIIALFCSGVTSSYAQDLKLGFISLKKVLDNYEKVKDGEDILLKEAEKKNAQRDKLVKEIKNLREKIDLLQDKQREKKRRELNEKVKKLQDFTYETRTDLRQKRDEKFMEIMKEVKAVIEEYGSSRNYNIIIDDTLLLYKDQGLNVTDDLIKILNQRYKK
ncbi:MAG: OmpH family outer membrane protein [Omnitrophica bacterium]|nr:OmpH family outer membrane protein [Candidatus Omnitrophota bacterium]